MLPFSDMETGMITSVANKRVKELVELSGKAKARNETGVFLVEGRKMFLEAPEDRIEAVYIEETFLKKASEELKQKLMQVPYEVVTQEVFAKISDTKTPQGILCVVRQHRWKLEDMLHPAGGKQPLLMILEDIQDPGNLGTILRTAEGAGVDGVIVTKNTVDCYHPKTIRATMGSLYRMPCVETEDLAGVLKQLRTAGIRTYAAHLDGTAYYDSFDYTQGTAFLIGNEGNGLKKETADAADAYVRIPMEGQVESLNAAIASTVFMYEANRQRRQQGGR